MYGVHELIFHSFILSFTLIYIRCSSIYMLMYFLVQLQFSVLISQYRPRVIFKYSFWQPEECVRQKDKQSCMHAFLQAVTAVKFPRKYSRQRDVTIITSTHVVINYHYHNNLTRRLEEKWITDLVMILKCPKVSCTRYCIIFYGELYYYLHFERINNFCGNLLKLKWA